MAKLDLEAGAACVMHVFFEEEVLVETLVEALRDDGSSSRCPWRLPADSTTGHLSTSLGWFSQCTNSKLPEHRGASKLHVIVRTAFMTATRAENFMAQVACHREIPVVSTHGWGENRNMLLAISAPLIQHNGGAGGGAIDGDGGAIAAGGGVIAAVGFGAAVGARVGRVAIGGRNIGEVAHGRVGSGRGGGAVNSAGFLMSLKGDYGMTV
ncbi:hypothetical protein DAPPUDRAFT_110835 [Daphnia pulex]|uniref:Uncharacterized protein n=1 Tax=Daphnia pulex TaxID=6669 RepID=E9H7A5_DAPPU|nr:hypothetical protein DAPPUDRAFT_110835 [Daphnia pulex]|eukprot:EFX72402.1 hypothetical protein DAPPUDRAFT_110835 [Daphnia pulex]